jgi:predicted TIM-barrel fold metal-dependent hydrolase
MPTPGSDQWRDSHTEDIVDPDRPIIDSHHHLFKAGTRWGVYALEDLWADTDSGHNIEKTVFIDCRYSYRADGPERMKPVGETEAACEVAGESAKAEGKATIAGIVSHADLLLGEAVEPVMAAHTQAGRGLFRGIRHMGVFDSTDSMPNTSLIPCPYGEASFRSGVRTIGRLGYTYDAFHFFHQNQDFCELAQACPDTKMILNHFAFPVGVGAYAGKQEEVFKHWKEGIAAVARCTNVVAKLGGLAMPECGFGWESREAPPTSDEFVEAQKRYYLHTIECFGPSRCMFESNFPVDKVSISYPVMWNGMKKIVADFFEDEKHEMFYGTAARVYRV